MKAFVFVNDNGAAYCRYAKNEIPAQFVYGVSKLEKMGFEVKVGEGRLFKDLVSFWKFKPDLFFMPFLKRKTMIYFILAKIFMFPTKFAGWMHLDVFSQPGSRLKRMIHSLLLPFLQLYVKRIDAIFFLSDKTREEIILSRQLPQDRCHFVPWGGEANFYAPFVKMRHDDKIISTGRENRDLPAVMNALKNSDVTINIYTSDLSLQDSYVNATGKVDVNKGRWEYKELLEKVSASKCMIIPLKLSKVNYCVGLSSLIEAISLGVPVIATYNPYWYVDIEKENCGIYIRNNSESEWLRALEQLNNNPALVEQMSKNALKVFKAKCDFARTEDILALHVDKLLRKM